MIGSRRISLDQLLLRGSTAAVAVERAVAPLRTGEAFPCCEHLTPELEAGTQTMAVVYVECPGDLMCITCGNNHVDGHPAEACIECGGAETLRPFIVDLTVQGARGSVILVRVDGSWICGSCWRAIGDIIDV